MKKLFREKDYPVCADESLHYYRCDPTLNVNCGKSDCYINGGVCSLTSNPEFAIDGSGPLTCKQRGEITSAQLKRVNYECRKEGEYELSEL